MALKCTFSFILSLFRTVDAGTESAPAKRDAAFAPFADDAFKTVLVPPFHPQTPCCADQAGPAGQQAARRAAFAWATDATFGRSGCGAPKVLADIVESLTGAVFLDCGK